MAAMTCCRWGDGCNRLGCRRQRNGLRNHLLDFRLYVISSCAGMGFNWFLNIPRKQALAARQLVLKVPIGFVALISGSYGPIHVGVLAPWSRTQGAVATVYRVVLPFQVQRLTFAT